MRSVGEPSNSGHHRARAASRLSARYPTGWEVPRGDVESVLLTLPPDVTRITATMRLSIEAEFGGWDLTRVRLYSDGTRKVLLTRKRPRGADQLRDTDQPETDDRPEDGAHAC